MAKNLSPRDWQSLRALLDQALELPAAEREAWIDSGAVRDPVQRQALRELLAAADRSSTVQALLETLPKVETDQFAPLPPSELLAGGRVGPYRLLRELGSGGMASVWLAERTDMLQGRQVALKLPHGSWRRADLAERLAREREILATLEHPHIARLYDAGVTAEGQPYLALEWVQGERIDEWCRRHALGVHERLQLFLQVIRAVAHAHTRLVIHRDLKPSNILVTERGEVKLLDFGIAKLLASGSAVATALTQRAGAPLTPAYAAPEQLLGQAQGTGVDVYSLGVVLFELLAGERPHVPGRASPAALEEAIAEGQVRRLSAAAPPALRGQLRGDIETVVAKALKSDAAERYATAAAFADDIERVLARRPVLAQPDRLGYRLRRFVVRNRLAVGVSALVVFSLVAGTAVALWQADRARAEQARAEQVKAFVASIFEDTDPWKRGAAIKPTAAELLQRAKLRADQGFADQPLVRIELLTILGNSLVSMREFGAATPMLREAVEASSRLLPEDDALAVRARMLLLDSHHTANDFDAARAVLEPLLPLLERHAARHPDAFATALLRGSEIANQQGDYKRMQELAERSLQAVDTRLAGANPQRMRALIKLANAFENQGDFVRARQTAEQAFDAAKSFYAEQPGHPELAQMRFVLGRITNAGGDWRAALPLIEQAITDTEAVYGSDAIDVGTMVRTKVATLLAAKRLPDALEASQRALVNLRRHHAPDSLAVSYGLVAMASIEAALRRSEAALGTYAQALVILHARIGDDKAYTQHVRSLRAGVLAQAGRSSEAVAELTDAQAKLRTLAPSRLATNIVALAMALRLDGKPREALEVLERDAALLKSTNDRLRQQAERGASLLALARHEEAWAALQQAAAKPDEAPQTPQDAELRLAMGRTLLALKRPAEAMPHLAAAETFWRGFDAGHRQARDAAAWLGSARLAMR